MTEHKNVQRRRTTKRMLVPLVAMGTLVGGVMGVTATPASATATAGYGCSYWSNISLGGGAYGTQGCGTQTSSYATANSAAPERYWGTTGSTTVNGGAKAQYGPAVFVSSPYDVNDNLTNTGQLKVFTSGTSSVAVQSKATGVGPSPFYTATPSSYPISATSDGYVLGMCTASSPTSRSGSASIVSGYVDKKLDSNGYPIPSETVAVPSSPAANTRIDFTLDNIVTAGVVEHGHMVFNEQIFNADGSITENAAHMYVEGPFALGDVIIGQATCGHA